MPIQPGEPGYTPPASTDPSKAVPGLINTAPGTTTVTPGTPVTSYVPKEAQASGYDPSMFTVTPEATVRDQILKITGKGSPLIQQAEARAREAANQRGVINSTMAIESGRKAVYDSALPIAMADAAAYERAGTNTSQAENVAKQFKAGAENTASIINSGEQNKAYAQAAEAALRDQLAQLQADTTLTVADKQIKSQELIAGKDNDTKLLLQAASDTAAMARTTLTVENQLAIAKIDQATKKELAVLDANNRQLLQTNANLANMYQETVKNIAAIATSETLSPLAKSDATQTQLSLLNQALKSSSEVAGTEQSAIKALNLGGYFFDEEGAATEASKQRAVLAAIRPEDIAPGNPAVITAINAFGRERWDGLLNVFERGAPYSDGTHQQLGLLAEEVRKAKGL